MKLFQKVTFTDNVINSYMENYMENQAGEFREVVQ